MDQTQRPRCLRRGSTVSRLLEVRGWIPARVWISLSSDRCVLSGRSHCDGPITCPEESYRVWCVWVWWLNLVKEAYAHWGCWATRKKLNYVIIGTSQITPTTNSRVLEEIRFKTFCFKIYNLNFPNITVLTTIVTVTVTEEHTLYNMYCWDLRNC